MPIPEPVRAGRLARWTGCADDNVVGYSVYREGERLNEQVLTKQQYVSRGDVVVKPVLRGGYETVYGSSGSQSAVQKETPVSFAFSLSPNPFVAQTRIEYAVPSRKAVNMVVYDVSGRKVKTLVSKVHDAGYYSVIWQGIDDRQRKVPSGIYFIRMETDEFRTQEKTLLVR